MTTESTEELIERMKIARSSLNENSPAAKLFTVAIELLLLGERIKENNDNNQSF